MKKYIYTVALSISLWSCGGGGGGGTPPPPVNNAPSTPTQIYPSNNDLCIDNAVNFQWNASSDPDGDTITYQIEVAKNAQFSPIAHSVSASSTNRTIALEKGVAYYWRIKATDSKNEPSNYSSVNQFYTEGEGVSNYLPFAPVLVAPALNAVEQGTTTVLQWTADDVDTEDTLTFDIYFGTVNPPALLAENQTEQTYTSPTLNASSTYYWKIVVKDDKGGETIGQIWNFDTD
jgi:hypothetical protein